MEVSLCFLDCTSFMGCLVVVQVVLITTRRAESTGFVPQSGAWQLIESAGILCESGGSL
jgi:hypothetical protein